MNTPAVIVVRSGRNPHAVCLALALVAISVYGLLFTPASVSVDTGLQPAQRVMFGALSVFGSALIVAGIYLRSIRTGLQVERAGQLLLAITSGVYVYALCQVSTFERSGLVTAIGCAIAIGSVWRIAQIRRDVKMLKGGDVVAPEGGER